MAAHSRTPWRLGIATLTMALGACGGGEAPATRNTVPDSSTEVVLPVPETSAVLARPPARDANQQFLRAMIDHHAGLIAIASDAITRAYLPATRNDAHAIFVRQEAEQKEMADMLRERYGDESVPIMMPEHRVMLQGLQRKAGNDYDQTFYQDVVAHHRETLAIIDANLPRLTDPDVRVLAGRVKQELQREVAVFQQKMQELAVP